MNQDSAIDQPGSLRSGFERLGIRNRKFSDFHLHFAATGANGDALQFLNDIIERELRISR